jgi:hypothetical protein
MQELKPVAWMYQHKETGVTGFADEQQIAWNFEKNNPRLQRVCALYALPDTHRIVSVKLLKTLVGVSYYKDEFMEACEEAQAIIDKEQSCN